MNNYDFHKTFRQLYDKAVKMYGEGRRGADSYFSEEELAYLASIGSRAQDIYDYAEDQNNYAEPDYDTALAIQLVRRDYFLNVQKGTPSETVLDEANLPAKGEAICGIDWLPRIIPKAKAKLRGELPTSLMYACGGDRKFFKANDIHPAEFLSLVWRHENYDAAIVDWVIARRQIREQVNAETLKA